MFLIVAAVLALCERPANAQNKTFYLDRLTIGGAPEDGIAVWRPVASSQTRLFAQMALGLSLNPLRAKTVVPDANVAALRIHSDPVVSAQLIDYMTLGAEISSRAALMATFPVTLYESGNDPSVLGVGQRGDLQPIAANDMRLELRAFLYRSDDKRFSFGAGASVFAPIGNQFSYGGDGATHTAWNLAVETYIRDVIVAVNTGLHIRPKGAIGDLTVGNEWTLAAGAFLPMRGGKVRLGAEVFMSTGVESLAGQSHVEKSTFLSSKNTPLEWMAEGRISLDKDNQVWAGGGLGTRLDVGYGAPDFRMVALIGYAYPLPESTASSPARRLKRVRERIAERGADSDHDGIPDDVDLCPTVPEDHLDPDPVDGCPKPPDRDGDGIPDEFDKCPDLPEDKDGIEDWDGCPEDDADKDGVPDVTDACPREPGTPSKDPKTNGCPQFIKRISGSTEIQILKQIQFDTAKATIKANSYGILDEIVKLLNANPEIKRMSIEGHTDSRGAVEMNNKLSQDRADSVMNYLTSHGIAADRVEAHGFGPSRPLKTNDTDAGRQANRRVEFHITQQQTGGT
jgi:outer membrane protein OmpA-like peptidoglycan-associated protein